MGCDTLQLLSSFLVQDPRKRSRQTRVRNRRQIRRGIPQQSWQRDRMIRKNEKHRLRSIHRKRIIYPVKSTAHKGLIPNTRAYIPGLTTLYVPFWICPPSHLPPGTTSSIPTDSNFSFKLNFFSSGAAASGVSRVLVRRRRLGGALGVEGVDVGGGGWSVLRHIAQLMDFLMGLNCQTRVSLAQHSRYRTAYDRERI